MSINLKSKVPRWYKSESRCLLTLIIKVFFSSPPHTLHNYLHCLCMAKNKMLRSEAACDKLLLVAAEVFRFLSLLLEFPVTSVALNSNSGEHCWSSQPLPLSSPLLSSPVGHKHTCCPPLPSAARGFAYRRQRGGGKASAWMFQYL